jgi:hypothetical protein
VHSSATYRDVEWPVHSWPITLPSHGQPLGARTLTNMVCVIAVLAE